MAMDGLSLHAMLWEARGLLGARVDKVQQPDKDTLLLSCHGSDCGRVKLLVNIHNENGRIALTRDTAENPAAAPRLLHAPGRGAKGIVQAAFYIRSVSLDLVEMAVDIVVRHGEA